MNTKEWEVPAADGWSKKIVGWSEDGYYYLATKEPTGDFWRLDTDPTNDDEPFRIFGHLMTVTENDVDWDAVPSDTLCEIDNAPTLLWTEQAHASPAARAAVKRLKHAHLLAN